MARKFKCTWRKWCFLRGISLFLLFCDWIQVDTAKIMQSLFQRGFWKLSVNILNLSNYDAHSKDWSADLEKWLLCNQQLPGGSTLGEEEKPVKKQKPKTKEKQERKWKGDNRHSMHNHGIVNSTTL